MIKFLIRYKNFEIFWILKILFIHLQRIKKQEIMTITKVKTFIQNQLVGTLIVDDSAQGFLHYVTPGSNSTPDYLNKKEDFDTMLEDVREWCEGQDEEVNLMMY